MAKPVVYVPVKLDAFVLNQHSSKGFPDNVSIAPISQPNYSFLRLDAALVQNDVLPYHDISHASPASANPRLTNLGNGKAKLHRQGVYLHWMLPRCYRSGASQQKNDGEGITAPSFKTAPDRWLVIRRLHPGAEPAGPINDGRIKEFTAWIVESNRIRDLQQFDKDVDIETDCSPYLKGGSDLLTLEGQAETYIGQKTLLRATAPWKEQAPDPARFVPLGTLNSANPLFADYVPHNMNVFSMLDNFEYVQGAQKAYLTKATASYYVLGWHAEENQDFLANPGPRMMSEILTQNFLNVDGTKDESWLANSKGGRVLCHGAMYTVTYSDAEAKTMVQPGADAARKFANPKSHPVTVGTTPLDTIVSYVRAYSDMVKQGGNRDEDWEKVQTQLLHLDTLLLKQEDDIDSQQEAHDMLSANNFEPHQDSGSSWNFSAAKSDPKIAVTSKAKKVFEPTQAQKRALNQLNNIQTVLDTAKRELSHERWILFSLWWKSISTASWQRPDPKIQLTPTSPPMNVPQLVNDQRKIVRDLSDRVSNLTRAINISLQPLAKQPPPADTQESRYMVELGSVSSFSTQKDPSILVPGLSNPWPKEWLDTLPARMATKVQVQNLPSALPQGWQGLSELVEKIVKPSLPNDSLRSAADTLLKEFFNLRPVDVSNPKDTPSTTNPHYHDGRDRWNNTQAWFPLFLEWEIRYYDVPFNAWDFRPVKDSFRPNENARIRYAIKPDQVVANVVRPNGGGVRDERAIGGRVLILPLPGYSLRVQVEQLLRATSEEDLPESLRKVYDPITEALTHDPQSTFLENISRIQMLSSPLTGFMCHLSTILQGTHIKPTFRDPSNPDRVEALGAAYAGSATNTNNPWTKEVLEQMGTDLDLTPFSDFLNFPQGISPLKPVTHGQFRFTKLNIIDKFGQCISAINPKPTNNVPPLYPNLSEYFHPQNLGKDEDNRDNVVLEDPNGCQFAQYPPAINQDSRLNSHFMVFDREFNMWRPCSEWEDPVWGFVLLNYAEAGVQIFLPDGQFYFEVRLGGKTEATKAPEWQPFEPPKDSNGKFKADGYPQLNSLMKQLADKDYIRSFIGMVNKALAALPHTPNQYAEYLNAIVGRPLALTNIGFSIELAEPSYKNHSTLNNSLPDVPLTTVKGQPSGYKFPVKIGDVDRAYDGLVCLFDQPAGADVNTPPGSELKLDEMITYYKTPGKQTTRLDRNRYAELKPYHLSSRSYSHNIPSDTNASALKAEIDRFSRDRYNQITMYGAMLDPFSKIHAYSGVLPIVSLQLPTWTLQAALQRMTAFFRMGPLILTTPDLQRQYRKEQDLTPDNFSKPVSQPTPEDAEVESFRGIPLPALASADWNWLQPYAVPTSTTNDMRRSKEQHWNAFPIAALDSKPKYEPGPYVAVEGFLQLKRPIVDGKLE